MWRRAMAARASSTDMDGRTVNGKGVMISLTSIAISFQ
jgi:hypothetical protein